MKTHPTKKAELKIAESMKAASSSWKIPLSDLKKLKAAGCPAFRGSRVHKKILDDWVAQHPTNDGGNESDLSDKERWQISLIKAQIRKLNLEHDLILEGLVSRSEVQETVAKAEGPMLKILRENLPQSVSEVAAQKLRQALAQIGGFRGYPTAQMVRKSPRNCVTASKQ